MVSDGRFGECTGSFQRIGIGAVDLFSPKHKQPFMGVCAHLPGHLFSLPYKPQYAI